jgi:16S rRNA processing protein RimM
MDLVKIGRTGKTHGSTGEIRIFITDEYLEDFIDAALCLIDIHGDKVPFFVESIRGKSFDICQFEDVKTPEEAKPITNAVVYLPADRVTKIRSGVEDVDYSGFTIRDLTSGISATILSVESFPEQEMAIVSHEGREILIPLHDLVIQSIDHERKVIEVGLAEGIWQL